MLSSLASLVSLCPPCLMVVLVRQASVALVYEAVFVVVGLSFFCLRLFVPLQTTPVLLQFLSGPIRVRLHCPGFPWIAR